MNIRHTLSLLAIFHCFQVLSQVPFEAITSGKTDLAKAIPNMEELCELPGSGWMNTGGQPFRPGLEKLTVIHTGSIHRIADFENMRNLSTLQQNYPQIRVLLITDNSELLFDQNDVFEDFLYRHDIHIPVFAGNVPEINHCTLPGDEARTYLLTPDRRVLDIRKGFLDIEKLGNDVFQLQGLLLDVYKSDKTPYFNNSPKRFEKILYWPALSGVEILAPLQLLGFSDYVKNQIFLSSEKGEIVEQIGSGGVGFADGDFQNARFNGPRGLAFHSDSSVFYVADSRNHRIRKVNPETMEVTTVLGNGSFDEQPSYKVIGTNGSICLPHSLHIREDMLYFTTAQGVYSMDLRTEVAELKATANYLTGVTTDENGIIYCSSSSNSKIYEVYEREIIPVAGKVSGLIDGKKDEILFSGPGGIEIKGREMLIADTYNNALRTLQFRRKKSETLAGPSKLALDKTDMQMPADLAVRDDLIYLVCSGNGTIRVYDEAISETRILPLKMGGNTLPPRETKILDLREGEKIKVGHGQTQIQIQLELDSGWTLAETYSSTAAVSPSESIEIRDTDLSDMRIDVAFEPEEEKAPGSIVLDLYLIVKNDSNPELKYQWNTSFVYELELTDSTETDGNAISITTAISEKR